MLASSLGCAPIVVSPEPFRCPPLTPGVLSDYEDAFTHNRYVEWRAWTREADKACRANEALIGD